MNLEDILLRDTRANQPLATLVSEGSLYYVTDESVTEQSRGGVWVSYSDAGGLAGISQLTGDVTAGPGSGSQAASIANNAVVTAKVNNDAITYAKMQNISAASILLGRGSAGGAGDPQEIALGTNLSMSGNTLNAAGGGGGGGGGLVLLGTLIAAASASLNFTSLITSDYDTYLFQINALKPATSGTLIMRLSSNNGASWLTGVDYRSVYRHANMSASAGIASSLDSSFLINGSPVDAAEMGSFGEVRLYNPLAATPTPMQMHTLGRMTDTSTYDIDGAGFYAPATSINAVQFLFDSGNIASGVIRLYGYANI